MDRKFSSCVLNWPLWLGILAKAKADYLFFGCFGGPWRGPRKKEEKEKRGTEEKMEKKEEKKDRNRGGLQINHKVWNHTNIDQTRH